MHNGTAMKQPEPPNEDFEAYMSRRRTRLRLALVAGVVAFIAVVAVPYVLMEVGSLEPDTFEIFVVADLFLLAGLARAFFIYLKDWRGIGFG